MADDRQQPGLFELDKLEYAYEELSALIDGELSEPRARAVREHLATDESLAERFAAMQSLQGELRRLAAAPLANPRRLAALRSRLDERLATGRQEPAAGRAIVSPAAFRWRRLRWLVPAGAAIAAGLALYLDLDLDPGDAWHLGGTRRASVDVIAPDSVAALPDDEVAIALELDTLSDLEVIEDLDLLELLDAVVDPEAAGGGGQI